MNDTGIVRNASVKIATEVELEVIDVSRLHGVTLKMEGGRPFTVRKGNTIRVRADLDWNKDESGNYIFNNQGEPR